MIVVGIGLEILAALLGTASKQLIAYSTFVNKKWMFHFGAFLNVFVGPLVDASAYGFAPQVVVAPFACLDVIFNMLIAPYTLSYQQERIGRYHVGGTILVATGAIFTAIFGSKQDGNLTEDQLNEQLVKLQSVAYLLTEGGMLLLVGASLKMKCIPSRWRGIALGCTAGVLMGNVFFLKGLLGIISHAMNSGDWSAFGRFTPYVCIAAAATGAVVGHLVMRRGLAEYKGVYMVTIFEGAHITAACLSGCIVMGEMSDASWSQWCSYWTAVALIIVGILLVNIASGARMGSVAQPNPANAESTITSLLPQGPRLSFTGPLRNNSDTCSMPNMAIVSDSVGHTPGSGTPRSTSSHEDTLGVMKDDNKREVVSYSETTTTITDSSCPSSEANGNSSRTAEACSPAAFANLGSEP